jgi:hypothetical protein
MEGMITSMKKVGDKKLYDPKTKREIDLSTLWKDMGENEILWINFFTRFV